MKRSHVFEAADGNTFATADECKRHEEQMSFCLLTDLTSEDIREALDRTNMPLSDAFERIGCTIAARRRKNGVLKRKGTRVSA